MTGIGTLEKFLCALNPYVSQVDIPISNHNGYFCSILRAVNHKYSFIALGVDTNLFYKTLVDMRQILTNVEMERLRNGKKSEINEK